MSAQTARRFFHYLNMDYLIAPFLIRLIYWIGVVAITSAGLGLLFTSAQTWGNSTTNPLLTIGGTLISLLLWRLLSEMLVLAFNIYARLVEIRDLLTYRKTRTETPRVMAPVPALKNHHLHPAIRTQHD